VDALRRGGRAIRSPAVGKGGDRLRHGARFRARKPATEPKRRSRKPKEGASGRADNGVLKSWLRWAETWAVEGAQGSCCFFFTGWQGFAQNFAPWSPCKWGHRGHGRVRFLGRVFRQGHITFPGLSAVRGTSAKRNSWGVRAVPFPQTQAICTGAVAAESKTSRIVWYPGALPHATFLAAFPRRRADSDRG